MRYFICTIVATVFLTVGVAQTTQTLGLDDYNSGTESLYESPNGGYAFGVNGYNDLVKAQTFSHDNSYVLRNVQMKFGIAEFESTDSTSSIVVNVYRSNDVGITISGLLDSIAPGDILASDTIPVYELEDDGSVTTVELTGEAIVLYPGEMFAVGLDVSQLAIGDTVALLSTTDGDAEGASNAWELTADSNWVSIAQEAFGWNLDVDLAIFAGIDENDPAGIYDYQQANWSLFPNPTTEYLNIVFNEPSFGKPIDLKVFNLIGELVLSKSIDSHLETNLNVNPLVAGGYILQLSNQESVSYRKFIKH